MSSAPNGLVSCFLEASWMARCSFVFVTFLNPFDMLTTSAPGMTPSGGCSAVRGTFNQPRGWTALFGSVIHNLKTDNGESKKSCAVARRACSRLYPHRQRSLRQPRPLLHGHRPRYQQTEFATLFEEPVVICGLSLSRKYVPRAEATLRLLGKLISETPTYERDLEW